MEAQESLNRPADPDRASFILLARL